MPIGFSGEFDCKLDSKHRLMLPARLRNKLEGDSKRKMVIRIGYEENLTLYTLDEMDNILKRFEGLDDFDPSHRAFKRNFMSGLDEIELDDTYRFLIPKRLIQELSLKKSVKVIGADNNIEIWDSQTWEDKKIKDQEAFSELSQSVMMNMKKGATE